MNFKLNFLSKPFIGLLLVAVPVTLFIGNQVRGNPLATGNNDLLTLSGTLEARQTHIASEVNARVVSVRVDKGNMVHAGDPLIDLDDNTTRGSLNEAEAGVRAAQAELDKVQETARPANLALAEAGVGQAQADLDAAKRAVEDANRALASPQDLTTLLHSWEARVAAGQGAVGQAQAGLASVKDQIIIAARDQSMAGKAKYEALLKQQTAAEAALKAAQADMEGSQHIVDLFRAILQNPLELKAALHGATNDLEIAQANFAIAQAELDIVRRSPQTEAVALAQARLNAAQANLMLVQAQAKRYKLQSPLDGIVLDRTVEPGETAQPGKALLAIANTDELEMTLYAPIWNLEIIRVGQQVTIHVPSVPEFASAGRITYIAQEGEFKPANIYDSQERSEMVFAVQVTVPNDGRLKAGLPADAVFQQ
jgi:multidrug resistance efflux pump